MKKVLGVFLGLIALIIAGAVGVLAFSGTGTDPEANPISSLVSDAKNTATNAAIDASGIKSKVQDALDSNRDAIAAATGLSAEQVDQAVADLDIESWQATSLPSEASASGSVSGSYAGVDGTITTYDDPGYVSVEAYGQTVTLAVPESAQQYLPLLSYVQ